MHLLRRIAPGLALAGTLAAAVPANPPASLIPTVNVRARFEAVSQGGKSDASALTLRAAVGLASVPWNGLRASLEIENVTAADEDSYDQAGLNPAAGGRATIADPEATELNQAWVEWKRGLVAAKVGRQRLVLDDARFVGDVGWRQNQQTFDAVVVSGRNARNGFNWMYGYLDRINRVLGNRHPQGNWRAEAHLAQAKFSGLPGGATLTAHASWLDLPSAPAQSCATVGLTLAGKHVMNPDLALTWRFGAAWQRDHGRNAFHYGTHYANFELGVARKRLQVSLVGEELGADGGQGFRTPLATLHAFNGWADVFATTPSDGLRDLSVRANADLPGGFALAARHHRFEAAGGGRDYGREWDVQLTRKFGSRVSAVAKVADFRAIAPGPPDVRKFWLQLEYGL